MARIGVITFPGSQDDRDAVRAVGAMGHEGIALWHRDEALGELDGIILPGGFSYGDYLRCGAIARFAPAMAAVAAFAERGGPVLGICNGFQILCEAGLLPGVLTPNHGRRFICKDVELVVERDGCRWTDDLPAGTRLTIPVKHHDGAWYLDEAGIAAIEARGQVVLRYAEDVNGAAARIAGVTNEAGNVCGLMPHPEHGVDAMLGTTDGRRVLAGLFAGAGVTA